MNGYIENGYIEIVQKMKASSTKADNLSLIHGIPMGETESWVHKFASGMHVLNMPAMTHMLTHTKIYKINKHNKKFKGKWCVENVVPWQNGNFSQSWKKNKIMPLSEKFMELQINMLS